jgi:2-amino-4-hydroxy-6-hydroxymethyldihydropteridine diphosphokinase
MTRTGFLGLGGNVGDPQAELQAAVDALPARGIAVLACSSTYATDPVGEVPDQPPFLNAAVRIATDLGPEAVLDAVKAVEAARGRVLAGEPGYVRHGPRPVDLDVLLLGDGWASERLTVPHPALLERRFALVPVLELDLDAATPGGTRLADALAGLPLEDGVRRAGPPLRVPAG